MDIQKMFDVMSDSMRRERSRYHLTLGDLIGELEKANGTLPVVFDNGGSPGSPHSYRGYYSDLSFPKVEDPPLVHGFLQTCKGSLGMTFDGYKGGDFLMEKDTPLWVASWGQSGGLAMVGASAGADTFVIQTKQID